MVAAVPDREENEEYKSMFAFLMRNPIHAAERDRQNRKRTGMKDLAGRTAFVTGGANGIGLGLARVLLDQGCKVAIADIREDSIEQALAVLDNREVTGIKLDVASRDGFAAAADEAEAGWARSPCCSTMPA